MKADAVLGPAPPVCFGMREGSTGSYCLSGLPLTTDKKHGLAYVATETFAFYRVKNEKYKKNIILYDVVIFSTLKDDSYPSVELVGIPGFLHTLHNVYRE